MINELVPTSGPPVRYARTFSLEFVAVPIWPLIEFIIRLQI